MKVHKSVMFSEKTKMKEDENEEDKNNHKKVYSNVVHYVNTESFWWYIVWRTCFYEDHSLYLPKYHAPLHAIYSRYKEISSLFSLGVDEINPEKFASHTIKNLQDTGNVYISCYWEESPHTKNKRKRDTETKDPCVCMAVNIEWALKYERLLHMSIDKGFLELKVVNGKPIIGNEEDQFDEKKPHISKSKKNGTSQMNFTGEDVKKLRGPSYDHGENPRQAFNVNIGDYGYSDFDNSYSYGLEKTDLQKQTLDFLRNVTKDFAYGGDDNDPKDEFEEPKVVNDPKLIILSNERDEIEEENRERLLNDEKNVNIKREDKDDDYYKNISSGFMKRMEGLGEGKKEKIDEVKVIISRKISEIHNTLERESIIRQIKNYSYSQIPNG